jgi:hypothetical protein
MADTEGRKPITMSESKRRMSKQQQLLAEHPDCYFCGGVNRATTIDHVPPRACFPDGYAPEGFEFPACKNCNEDAAKQDQIFGFYAMLLDFDESKMGNEDDAKKLKKLRQGIANNYPEALPNQTSAYPLHRVGSIITFNPSAIVVDTAPAFKEAATIMGQKLTHALYLLETGKILTANQRFLSSCYQPQREGTETLTSYFNSLLPKANIGSRTNIKSYGTRFNYIFGYKEEDDFLIYSAQFGRGLILWGIVCGPTIKTPEVEPLKSAPWKTGACGAGANKPTT